MPFAALSPLTMRLKTKMDVAHHRRILQLHLAWVKWPDCCESVAASVLVVRWRSSLHQDLSLVLELPKRVNPNPKSPILSPESVVAAKRKKSMTFL